MVSFRRANDFLQRFGIRALIMRGIEYTIIHLVALIVGRLGEMLTSEPGLVIFGASKGARYDDNSRYAYEFAIEEQSITPVWLTRNRSVYVELSAEGKPVEYIFGFGGIRALLRADVGVFTNSLEDIAFHPSAVPRDLTLLALRHGKSLKRTRFAQPGPYPRKHVRECALTDLAIATSEYMADIQEECLQIGRENHFVTGLPRNDQLFSVVDGGESNHEIELINREYDITMLYAPTWRHGLRPTEFFPFDDFEVDHLISFLEEHNCLLLIRPHPKDLELFNDEFDERALVEEGPVKLASHHEIPDTNTLLPHVDILITDYSSIYFDFLLLDRPIVFVPYDYDEFEAQIGFVDDYFDLLPGPQVSSFSGLIEALTEHIRDPTESGERREAVATKVHRYRDGKSSERVVRLIEQLSDT